MPGRTTSLAAPMGCQTMRDVTNSLEERVRLAVQDAVQVLGIVGEDVYFVIPVLHDQIAAAAWRYSEGRKIEALVRGERQRELKDCERRLAEASGMRRRITRRLTELDAVLDPDDIRLDNHEAALKVLDEGERDDKALKTRLMKPNGGNRSERAFSGLCADLLAAYIDATGDKNPRFSKAGSSAPMRFVQAALARLCVDEQRTDPDDLEYFLRKARTELAALEAPQSQ